MRSLLLAILFYVFSLQSAFAQQTNVTADVNVRAVVTQSIQLITVNSMQFGNAQPGQGEIYVNPIRSLNAGYMIATGSPEAEFRLNYLPELELTQVDGDGSLTFEYILSGNTEEDQSTSELLETDNRNIQFNSEGRFYIWIGGRMNIENAIPGNYEGDFTIEIDYI